MALLKLKAAIKEGRPHMKVNLKTTNEAENAAETPPCHQRGQRTVNGIIGNTRRGIVVDKTLDPDSNNPVANKPVSTALAALAGQLEKGQVVFLDQLPESGEPHKVYVLTATNQRYWWDGSAFVNIVPTTSACIIKIDSEKRTYTSNIPLPWNKFIPVYAIVDGYLYPLVYNYQSSASGNYFEMWTNKKITAGVLKPDGTVEFYMDRSRSLLVAPRPGILDESYLLGAGPDGEEVIEIGDNLTLANGKLSATGRGVNFLQATLDEPDVWGYFEGTYTGTIDPNKVNVAILPDPKNKYTLLTKITDEGVGSATIITDRQPVTLSFANNEIHRSPAGTYFHFIHVQNSAVNIDFNYYSTYGYRYRTSEELKNKLQDKIISCSGFIRINNKAKNARAINLRNNTIEYFDNDTGENASINLTGDFYVGDKVFSVETGMEVDNFDPGPR